jgi:hypothetical protein
MQDHDPLDFTYGISQRINEPLKQDRDILTFTYGIPLRINEPPKRDSDIELHVLYSTVLYGAIIYIYIYISSTVLYHIINHYRIVESVSLLLREGCSQI